MTSRTTSAPTLNNVGDTASNTTSTQNTARLAEHAAAIRCLGKRIGRDVVEIGARLTKCKPLAGHGNWLAWLEREFGWKEQTARNFMQVHEASLKSPNFGDLDLPISALYALAAPSTPTSALDEVLDLAANGQRLRLDEVREIIAAHSPEAVLQAARDLGATPPNRGGNTGVAMHPYVARGDDTYETPACAIEALLKVETFRGKIWEPACCRGAIVRVLREHGHQVVATGLRDHGCPDSTSGIDFLTQTSAPAGATTIITNPPFMLDNEFVRHALTLAPRVAMLLRLLFLESQGRCDIIDGGSLRRVYPFIDRLPMMHREGWQGPKDSSQIQFAWFCWDRRYQGDIVVRRIWARERVPASASGDAILPSVSAASS